MSVVLAPGAGRGARGAGAALRPHTTPVKGTILWIANLPQTTGLNPTNTAGYHFVSRTVTTNILSLSTKVAISAGVDLATTSSSQASGSLSVCAQLTTGGALKFANNVYPQFTTPTPDQWFAQSDSGFLTNLSPAKYRFGLCMSGWSASTEFGNATGTVMVAAG